MLNIEVRRPRIEDRDELHQFFRTVVTDTFRKEGLSALVADIENEIESKKQYLQYDLDSNGKERYFLIACDKNDNKIIGSIEHGPASSLMINCTNGRLKGVPEIGTVFVLPDFQRRGIGSLLLNVMFLTLLNRGINEFCLDSGYKTAQKIWKKKFGAPDYLLKNYWGEGQDHMIWKRRTADMQIIF
ncbi:GNAT family N-acetyltransferase [Fictibacillus gelatini]|uniref:GNAT family N-acetyltransferase n=1 Tax=Fictibacillus gelatini TaxID=225985 RepID=UPI0003F9E5BA|nr:GNAT family N-acetyltransferase [Fictibacillus gelatini]